MTTQQKLLVQGGLPALVMGGQVKAKPRANNKLRNSVCKVSEEERRQMIAANAYFRAQARNFSPGDEQSDWLTAETEVDEMLRRNILK